MVTIVGTIATVTDNYNWGISYVYQGSTYYNVPTDGIGNFGGLEEGQYQGIYAIQFANRNTHAPGVFPAPYVQGGNARRRGVYYILKGITIPMGATINSAVFKYGVITPHTSEPIMEIKAKQTNNPSTVYPITGTPVARVQKLQSQIINPGKIGTKVGWVKSVGGNTMFAQFQARYSTGTNPLTAITDYPTGTNYFAVLGKQNVDVKNIVQRLVDLFDFNNDSMHFDLTYNMADNSLTTNTTGLDQDLYGRGLADYHPGPPTTTTYAPSPTSYGQGKYTAKLFVDFSAGAPPVDSAFSLDADLALAPYLRSCTKQDAKIVYSTPVGDNDIVATAIINYLVLNGDTTGFGLIANVINPVTNQPYNTGAIKNNIGYLNRTGQIIGLPYVPPPGESGAYNFKKTTWHEVP